MSWLRLLPLLLRAEALRLRLFARRQLGRAILAAVAAVFVLGALAMLHVAALAWIGPHVGVPLAALILAALDVVLALILLALAARDRPGRAEREAGELRERAGREALAAALSGRVLLTVLLQALRAARRARPDG